MRGQVSASTQNQALHALVFLYGEVLGISLPDLDGVVRARQPGRLPVVLDRSEVRAVLAGLTGVSWLAGMLLYGAGLRLSECLDLRVKDIDFERNAIAVRQGKGAKDRMVPLPAAVRARQLPHVSPSCATHLLEDGYDIRTDQELLGHASVTTTMIYTHVINRGALGVKSPADRL